MSAGWHYRPPGPVARAFIKDESFVCGIMGPFGSGKSTASVMKLTRNAQRQAKAPDGKQYRRTAIIRNCYDDQTEILTERRGWVLFKDLAGDDKVAMLDGDRLVFAQPSYYYQESYVGEMVGFKNEGLDFLVTPNHRMYVSKCRGRAQEWGEYEFKLACEVYGDGRARVRRDARWDGVDPGLSEAMFEWLGFWFAEGHATVYVHEVDRSPRHHCIITQMRPDGIAYARDLFARAGLPFTETDKPGGGSIFRLRSTPSTKPLIAELAACGKAVGKRVQQRVKDAPPGHIRAFLHGFIMGDGCVGETMCAYTSSRGLADDLQELALRAGMVANLSSRDRRGMAVAVNGTVGAITAEEWTVTFLGAAKRQPRLKAQGYAGRYPGWYKTTYAGTVYCIEVPTHVIYVRRNGRAFWCSQSYPELKTTTIKTWEQWYPKQLGKFREQGPPSHMLELGDLRWEVMFVALDQANDVKKLLSMELSDAWINEAREVPKAIVDGLTGRVGRYPAVRDGGCTGPQVLMDTNPPDTDHWWYRLAEEEQTDGWAFFRQPGGLRRTDTGYEPHPEAENVGNLPEGYYRRQVAGKSAEWVTVYLCAEYGFVQDGKPVFPEYVDSVHCRDLDLAPKSPLLVGLDFGLTPAAIIGQRQPMGGILWRAEIVTENMGALRFAQELGPVLRGRFGAWQVERITGDPAGDGRAQTDEETVFQILRANGISANPANTNDFTLRREAIAGALTRLTGGLPGLVIHPECKVTRKGMAGGYRYKRIKVSGDERFHDQPDKNAYSHPVEAGGYLMLGAGEGSRLLRREQPAPPRRRSAPQGVSPWAA